MRRRPLFPIRRSSNPGDAPGTLIGRTDSTTPVIDIVAYGNDSIIEKSDVSVSEIAEFHEHYAVTWINVVGLADSDLIARIGASFNLHVLALEDVLNTHQRPKAEEFENYLYLVTRMLSSNDKADDEQVSIFLGSDFVLTVQENRSDCWNPVRKRLRLPKSRIRSKNADYLAYALLDAVIDDYFPLLEQYGEYLEKLEDSVITSPTTNHVAQLHDLKRELLAVRRAVWPQREMINSLLRDESEWLSKDTLLHLRDVYDHTIQLMDIIETYREIASGLVDVYISSVSAKLNEIMKVLTIISTIFIPLGFIASLYGMNFDRTSSSWNMPELGWQYGYLFALAAMTSIALGLLIYFFRKGWIGARRREPESELPGALPLPDQARASNGSSGNH